MSEVTLLPVVIQLRESRTLIARFRVALAAVLHSMGVDPATTRREIDAGGSVAIAPTASRRVLGVMNDLAFQAKWALGYRPPATLLQLSLELGEVPCGPLREDVQPAVATRRRLAHEGSVEGPG